EIEPVVVDAATMRMRQQPRRNLLQRMRDWLRRAARPRVRSPTATRPAAACAVAVGPPVASAQAIPDAAWQAHPERPALVAIQERRTCSVRAVLAACPVAP